MTKDKKAKFIAVLLPQPRLPPLFRLRKSKVASNVNLYKVYDFCLLGEFPKPLISAKIAEASQTLSAERKNFFIFQILKNKFSSRPRNLKERCTYDVPTL